MLVFQSHQAVIYIPKDANENIHFQHMEFQKPYILALFIITNMPSAHVYRSTVMYVFTFLDIFLWLIIDEVRNIQ